MRGSAPHPGSSRKKALIFLAAIFAFLMACPAARADPLDELIQLTKSENASVRLEAVEELVTYKDGRARDVLLDILQDDPDETARADVASSLSDYHGRRDPRISEELVNGLKKDPSAKVRASAASSLGSFLDPQVTAALIGALSDGDSSVRSNAVNSLAKASAGKGECAASRALIGALSDPDRAVRASAAYVQRDLKDADAVPPLILLLKDDYEIAREYAACALGAIGDTQAVNAILPLLKDTVKSVRDAAEEALRKLGVSDDRLTASKANIADIVDALMKKASGTDNFSDPGEYVIRDTDEALEKLAVPGSNDAEAVRSKIFELECLKKRQEEAKGRSQRAYELIQGKNPQAALSEAGEAIRLDPESGLAHYRLAYALSELGRNEEAITECGEAIRLDPAPLTFYALCGWLYGQLGDFAKERDMLEEGIRHDPYGQDLANVHGNLGYAHKNLGNFQEALSHYELAIIHGHRDKDAIQNTVNELKRSLGR